MNLPKLILSITVVILLVPFKSISQRDSLNKGYRFSIDAGIIINRSFSHFPELQEQGRSGSESITRSKGGQEYLPGFCLGFTSMWGDLNRGEFILGLSSSVTQGRYHYSNSSFSEGQGYSGKSITTEVDINSQFIKLNYEFGYRVRIFRNFFIQQSFVVNQNIQTIRKENGVRTSVDFSSSTTPSGAWVYNYYYRTDEAIHSTRYISDYGINISAKLSAFYQFKIRKKEYAAFIYRNLALKAKLPWWGLGVSFIL